MPQEIEVWYVIPAIRRDMAQEMKKLGLKQQEIASKLSLTVPAVSQYITGKRGKDVIFCSVVKKEIRSGALRIIEDTDSMIPEVQKICNLIRRTGILCKISRRYHDPPKGCRVCMEGA